MAAEIITIPYSPRDAFLPYHDNTKRNSITVAHRRAGKTVARINKLIKYAASCELDNPRFGYLAPYYVQAKDIAWGYLKSYASPILEYGGKVNESELSVTFSHNNAVIRLYGADNADRMRGLYFDGLVVDEAQDIRPSVATQILMPALVDRKGWLDISGTPKGWHNLLGQTYLTAQVNDSWYLQVLKASETNIIPQDELLRLKESMPENEYLQEFECSFEASITGAYYAKELQKADEEKRICSVPYDHAAKVHTAWDLGIADSMAIWFFQLVGKEIRFIDYLEASGYGLDYYINELQKKGYLYGEHYAPHDIRVRELSTGKSRLEIAKGLGINFTLSPDIGLMDGINLSRMMLNRSWFDANKCRQGYEALKNYREKIDEKRGISLGVLHDWTSHAADAIRMAFVSVNEKTVSRENRPRQHIQMGWMG